MLFADYETYVAAQDRVSALYKVSRKRNLKPQDSFGEFDKKNSWYSESAGNHQKTPPDLPAIVWNDIL